MFPNTQPQNNSNKVNVTSTLRNLFSDISCLRLSFWNDMLSLRFFPCTGTGANGLYQYDYARKIGTAIGAEKCLSLHKILSEQMLPKIELYRAEKKFEGPVSIAVGVGVNGNLLSFRYDMDATGKPYAFITVHTGVGADEKAPIDGSMSYKFNKMTILKDYDPETGSHVAEEIEAEFMYFMDLLKRINDTNCASPHAAAANPTIGKNTKNTNGMGYGAPAQSYGTGYQAQPAQATYSAPVSDFSLPF